MGFIPENLIDDMSSLAHVMAWFPTGDRLASEPIMIQFTERDKLHYTDVA